jgi:predicted DNA-binding transcriptional regulator AlpA
MPLRAQPIAVKENTAAAMLDMSTVEFRRLVGRGALPPPCEIGDLARWRVSDLEAILIGTNQKPDDDDDFE